MYSYCKNILKHSQSMPCIAVLFDPNYFFCNSCYFQREITSIYFLYISTKPLLLQQQLRILRLDCLRAELSFHDTVRVYLNVYFYSLTQHFLYSNLVFASSHSVMKGAILYLQICSIFMHNCWNGIMHYLYVTLKHTRDKTQDMQQKCCYW